MKIYTKSGDGGDTSLFGGGRVPKSHHRVSAYGDIDELNAALGLAHASLVSWHSLRGQIESVQKALFGIGGEVATETEKGRSKLRGLVSEEEIVELEKSIDSMEEELPPLKTFILPGGGPSGAALHLARTVCRRAERSIVGLCATDPLRPEILRFLNRLSDWLFVAARYVNHRERHPEIPW